MLRNWSLRNCSLQFHLLTLSQSGLSSGPLSQSGWPLVGFYSELVLWQREYFNHAFNRLRLTDCAGFDELLGIRGLKYVAALAGIPGCRRGTGKYVHADAVGLQLALKASASGHIQHQS